MALNNLRNIVYMGYESLLTEEIKEYPIPAHVAVIQDGNRRYAKRIGKPPSHGHIYGAYTTEKLIEWCVDIGVKQLTIYTFSTENFRRPYTERMQLYKLFKEKFDDMCIDERIHRNRVQIRAIGDIGQFPIDVRLAIERAEQKTKDYDNFHLNVALAYGGRQEIVDAARKIAQKVLAGELRTEDIDESIISAHLYSGDSVNVDLIIRTGGEERTSNFLPWQASGNECAAYFCAPYWPEFRKIDFLRAVRTYQMRESEKRRNTILRMIKLLSECSNVEVEEVINLSRRILNITRKEVLSILHELPVNVRNELKL